AVNPGHVLILDDEAHFCEFLREVTKGFGYEAEFATTRSEFRRLYDEFRPGVILLDLHMPDADGVEILQFLGQRDCRAQVLLISGYDPRVTRSAERLGGELGLRMLGVLQKPVSVADLEAVLRPHVPAKVEITREMLRTALDEGQFQLVYQPKVDLQT